MTTIAPASTYQLLVSAGKQLDGAVSALETAVIPVTLNTAHAEGTRGLELLEQVRRNDDPQADMSLAIDNARDGIKAVDMARTATPGSPGQKQAVNDASNSFDGTLTGIYETLNDIDS